MAFGTIKNVRKVFAASELASGSTEPVVAPGWPTPDNYPVREALAIIINEEWWHRQFAERDLEALPSRPSAEA